MKTIQSSAMPDPIIITICISCRMAEVERSLDKSPTSGMHLLAAVQAAAEGVAGVVVRPTQCLSVCKRVCTASLSGAAAYTFLFGDLDPERDAVALVEMAKACAASPHGFVPWKARPEALRKGIIARVPPPGWSPDDGSAPA
jgi:predicted metal-binding protein